MRKKKTPLPAGEGVGGGATGRGSQVAGIGSIQNPQSAIQNPKSDTPPSVRFAHSSLPSGEGWEFEISNVESKIRNPQSEIQNHLLAHWREAGEWWSSEPQREVMRFIDPHGIRREVERSLPSVGILKGAKPKPENEDYSEEWNLRLKKTRDEKVARACGLIPRERILEDKTASPLEGEAGDPDLSGEPGRGSVRVTPPPHPDFSREVPPPRGGRGELTTEEQQLRVAEDLAPYGLSRKEIGRARRLRKLPLNIKEKSPRPAGEGAGGGEFRSQNPTPKTQHLISPPSVRSAHCSLPSGERCKSQCIPLHLYSGYAFGRGTMLAEEIPLVCASIDIPAVAIVDPFSMAGCVELVKRSQGAGIKPLVGASVQLECGGWLVLLAKSKIGYQNLSQLISACHLEEPRQFPMCNWQRLERFSRDLVCLTAGDIGPINRLVSKGQYNDARNLLDRLVAIYGKSNLFIEIERCFLPWEIQVNNALLQIAEEMQITPVAGGLITHARREHFPAQDVLVCAETLCTVDEIIGRKLPRDPSQPQVALRPERALNAERFLRTPKEMAELFSDRPDLLENTRIVARRCDDEVLPGRTRLPEIFPNPNHALREITYAGAMLRHKQISPKLKKRLEYELDRIIRLNFAGHFLAIWDACRWASDQGIHLSGRGSVVDSAVAYCLGLSRIDAFRHNLHFDRFLPADASKRPDIDVDFEARRRDDVRAYFTKKYGADRVAGIAAIGAYCSRGIIREVGKALGLPPETIGFLAKRVHGGIPPDQLESALEKRPELAGSGIPKERFRWVFEMAERLMDVPRNMRAHSSGLVVSDRPISETAPVMWSASPFVRERIPGESAVCSWQLSEESFSNSRSDSICDELPTAHCQPPTDLFPIIQWDKRSAKQFFDKFDILCLRGQDVLAGTQERIRLADKDFRVDTLPMDDEETYRAMRSGELIGIPQSASPAMRQAHIRLRTADLHDASLVQAGIRPGVGGAVKINELIARRRGKPYSFEHPELEKILGLTYGIIVFQEQVDQLLQTFCGYTSGEAEDIREAIHKRRREDYGAQMKREIIERIVSNGFTASVAEQVYDYVSGFKGYGFAQGHALAFAEISIRSIYCQQNYPAEYFASLLTAQPAGYYGPCTLVNEARLRGAAILPPDVNKSAGTFSVEDVQSSMDPKIVLPNAGIRVGLMQVKGLSVETRKRIVAEGSQVAGRRSQDFAPTESRSPFGRFEILLRQSPGVPSGDFGLETKNENEESFAEDAHEFVASGTKLKNAPLPVGEGAGGGVKVAPASSRHPYANTPPSVRFAHSSLPNGEGSNSRLTPNTQYPTPFPSFFDFVSRTRPERDELENLILCGALDSLHPNRRAMLWAIPKAIAYAELSNSVGSEQLAVSGKKKQKKNFPSANCQLLTANKNLPLSINEPEIPQGIADFSDAEKAIFERALLDLDVQRHLMAFERERVKSRGGITCAEAKKLKPGRKAIVVGNPIRLRFPPTPSGKRVVFFDLEDETGLLNVTCFDAVYRRDGHAIVCSPYVTLIGVAQDRDGHTAFLAQRVFAYDPVLNKLSGSDEPLPLTTADFLSQ